MNEQIEITQAGLVNQLIDLTYMGKLSWEYEDEAYTATVGKYQYSVWENMHKHYTLRVNNMIKWEEYEISASGTTSVEDLFHTVMYTQSTRRQVNEPV